MKINESIYPILTEFGVGLKDGTAFLLLKYFDVVPSFIPEILEAKMNRTGIYHIDHNNSLAWRIPLFEQQETAFDWVKTEYRQMFKNANPDKSGNGNTCVRLMKKFFADNPDVRKDDVIGATDFYIKNTDSKYLRFSHYFILKGSGATKISELTAWIEKYKEYQERATGRTGVSITMQ